MKSGIKKISLKVQEKTAETIRVLMDDYPGNICCYIFHNPKMPDEVSEYLAKKNGKAGKENN
jgi:hypothetical protein